MFKVFQIELDDAKYREVNEAGDWSKVAWGKVYLDLTMGMWTDGDNVSVMEMILEAAEFGLIRHTMTIDCEELEQVFALGNGMGDMSKVTEHCRHKSMSVGDIAIRADSRGGGVTAQFGFEVLTEQEAKEIETLVPQKMMLA